MPFKTQSLKDKAIAVAEAATRAGLVGEDFYFHDDGAPCCTLAHVVVAFGFVPDADAPSAVLDFLEETLGLNSFDRVAVINATDGISRYEGLAALRAIPVAD